MRSPHAGHPGVRRRRHRARCAPRQQGARRAHDHGRRARRVRRRRDVVGRARHQRVVPPRSRGGGTDLVLRLSPADRRLQRRATAPTRPARSAAIPASRWTRSQTIERLPTIRAVTAHVGTGATFKYKDKVIRSAGHGGLHAELDRGRRRRHLSRAAASPTPRTATARRVVLVNDKLAEQLFGDVGPDRQGDQDRRRRVHGDRLLSLHGEPDGHADVGGRRRLAEGDRPVRDGAPPPQPLDARQQPHREAARRRRRRGSGGRRHRRAARAARPATERSRTTSRSSRRTASGRSTRSCSAPSSSSGSRCRRSACSSAAWASSRS